MRIDVIIGLIFFGLLIGFWFYSSSFILGYPIVGLMWGGVLIVSILVAEIGGTGIDE